MPGYRDHSKFETWSVSELVDASSIEPKGRRKVTIPIFQRRLVWSKSKREELIDSIKKGFPIGSLLMYRNDETSGIKETYNLIDGLQRTQALRRYCEEPNSSFRKTGLSENLISIIAGELNPLADVDCMTKRSQRLLRDVILRWIWDGKGFRESDGWSIESLTKTIIKVVLGLEEDAYDFYVAEKTLLSSGNLYREPLVELLNSIRLESDIGEAQVPVIIYTGAAGEVSKVFERLNYQGQKLTIYEIFAAQWINHRQQIENPKIIKAIWNKYEELENYGYDLDVSREAPDEQSRRDRAYTLFEYVFGLGQLLTKNYPLLFKRTKVDEPAPVGFNLMSACLGLGVNDKGKKQIPDKLRSKGVELKKLEQCILESTAAVHAALEPILTIQPEQQTNYEYYHSELSIVSMIASAFHFRYQLHNGISDNPGWEERLTSLLKNVPMYYLFDILTNFWSGTGDTKLKNIIKDSSYLKPLSKSQWESNFNLWHTNHIAERIHSKLYSKYHFKEYLLLRYVFFKRLRATDTIVVQRIISTKSLLSAPSYFANHPGPINSIGNLALVAEDKFVDFGDKTFAEYLDKQRRTGAIRGPGRFVDEKNRFEKQLICKTDLLPSMLTKDSFEKFINQRFEKLKEEFFKAWRDHIEPNS